MSRRSSWSPSTTWPTSKASPTCSASTRSTAVTQKPVVIEGRDLVIAGHKVRTLRIRDPMELPWNELGVDLVFECTGALTRREDLEKHVQAGARFVLFSAPSKGEDVETVIHGVNIRGGARASSRARAARRTASRRSSRSSVGASVSEGGDDDRARLHRRPSRSSTDRTSARAADARRPRTSFRPPRARRWRRRAPCPNTRAGSMGLRYEHPSLSDQSPTSPSSPRERPPSTK